MLFGCGGSSGNSSAQIESYPIDSTVVTTLEKTVGLSQSFSGTIDPIDLKDISDYDQHGYGVWNDNGRLAAVVRDSIMAAGYIYPEGSDQKKLLRFFAITDIHIIDKESPSQLIYIQHAKNADGTAVNPKATTNTSIYSPTNGGKLKVVLESWGRFRAWARETERDCRYSQWPSA